ncbi:hypothetical protein ABT301_21575 [Streptomyces sp. NPDC000987]
MKTIDELLSEGVGGKRVFVAGYPGRPVISSGVRQPADRGEAPPRPSKR